MWINKCVWAVNLCLLVNIAHIKNAKNFLKFDFLVSANEGHCSENWDENRHSPQYKRQRICSACIIYFLTGKNMAALSELILQIVTYFHAGSHIKPWRVKMHLQMREGRKEHKNNEHRHLVFSAFALDMNWLELNMKEVFGQTSQFFFFCWETPQQLYQAQS